MEENQKRRISFVLDYLRMILWKISTAISIKHLILATFNIKINSILTAFNTWLKIILSNAIHQNPPLWWKRAKINVNIVPKIYTWHIKNSKFALPQKCRNELFYKIMIVIYIFFYLSRLFSIYKNVKSNKDRMTILWNKIKL